MNSRSDLEKEAKKRVLSRIKNRQSSIVSFSLFALYIVWVIIINVNDVEKVKFHFLGLAVALILLVLFAFLLPIRPKFSKENLDRVFQEILSERKRSYLCENNELVKRLERNKGSLEKLSKL